MMNLRLKRRSLKPLFSKCIVSRFGRCCFCIMHQMTKRRHSSLLQFIEFQILIGENALKFSRSQPSIQNLIKWREKIIHQIFKSR